MEELFFLLKRLLYDETLREIFQLVQEFRSVIVAIYLIFA
jgi:hypothetical protein